MLFFLKHFELLQLILTGSKTKAFFFDMCECLLKGTHLCNKNVAFTKSIIQVTPPQIKILVRFVDLFTQLTKLLGGLHKLRSPQDVS